ncbi:MAG: hypothetical protein J3K34DRAFT_518157 [Monoraphidium minutum]|nr:MAG: hypothetical protein J3K34DRAFT_518157 [Monoraphidium minutum]
MYTLALLLLLAAAPRAAGAAKRARRKVTPREGPVATTIEERGLLAVEVDPADLAEGAREWHSAGGGGGGGGEGAPAAAAARRRFAGSVLGYVTPWNRWGYEAAVTFRGKLTHVSPVWYQLRLDPDGQLALVGGHEFNASWIGELRAPLPGAEGGGGGAACAEGAEAGGEQECSAAARGAAAGAAPPLVVPRVIVELDGRGVGLLLGRPGPAIERLLEEVTKRGYDGLVLECWQAWARGFEDEGFRSAALGFMKQLGANLVDAGKVLILAVPPALPASPGRPHADTDALASLADVVAGFSVMTYDHLVAAPGHNGPLPWQRRNLELLLEAPGGGGGGGGDEKKKEGKSKGRIAPGQVLLGVNFYGYEFSRPEAAPPSEQWSSDAVMGPRFLSVLARLQPPLRWDADEAEHHIKFKDGGRKRQMYFPTPASLDARLRLAREWGAGLSIWELGQGLEALLDAL